MPPGVASRIRRKIESGTDPVIYFIGAHSQREVDSREGLNSAAKLKYFTANLVKRYW